MQNQQAQNRNFETIAWGVLFVWWGVTELFSFLPTGTGMLGIGLILLGLNVARMRSGIPVSWFTLTLGIIALVWGGLALLGGVLALPYQVPIFAIVLVAFGVSLLVRGFVQQDR